VSRGLLRRRGVSLRPPISACGLWWPSQSTAGRRGPYGTTPPGRVLSGGRRGPGAADTWSGHGAAVRECSVAAAPGQVTRLENPPREIPTPGRDRAAGAPSERPGRPPPDRSLPHTTRAPVGHTCVTQVGICRPDRASLRTSRSRLSGVAAPGCRERGLEHAQPCSASCDLCERRAQIGAGSTLRGAETVWRSPRRRVAGIGA